MLHELIGRLKSETPKWFRGIIYGGISIGSTAVAIEASLATIPNFTVSPLVDKILQYAIVAGVVATAIASTACKSPETLPKKKKKEVKPT